MDQDQKASGAVVSLAEAREGKAAARMDRHLRDTAAGFGLHGPFVDSALDELHAYIRTLSNDDLERLDQQDIVQWFTDYVQSHPLGPRPIDPEAS